VTLDQIPLEFSYEGGDLEALATLRRYREWILSHLKPFLAGDAVEIGAGIGNMADHLYPHVSTLNLIEPSPNLIGPLRTKFASKKNVQITPETFEAFVSNAPDCTYDTVILINVLEHIEDDIHALSECHRILRPGGALLILVPALPFLFSKLDSLVGHFRRYTKYNLETGIENAGFEIKDMSYFDMFGIIPWWLINTIGGATSFNPKLVNLYDSLFVPVMRAIEMMITPPIGKNLIAVSIRQ